MLYSRRNVGGGVHFPGDFTEDLGLDERPQGTEWLYGTLETRYDASPR